MYKLYFLLLFLGFGISLSNPSTEPVLFKPKPIQKAYAKQTRQVSGAQGPKYWQNNSKYNISVTLDTTTHQIRGKEKVTYFNNSPAPLAHIIVKLDMNFFRKGNLRHHSIHPSRIKEGLVLDLVKEGERMVHDMPNDGILKINLRDTLHPGKSQNFTFEWHYPIPYGNDQGDRVYANFNTNSFFIGYWYPHIAVYDDIQGWDKHSYDGQHEFYNDFSDFNVSIHVPASMMVWATGEWQNPEKVLISSYLRKYQSSLQRGEEKLIFSDHEIINGKVFKKIKEAYRTFEFKAREVPDFAWSCSSQYNWLAASIEVDASTKRRTLLSLVYPSSAVDYPKVFPVVRDGIKLMSQWLPKVSFPYPGMTIFNGDDRMEFPMISNQYADRIDNPQIPFATISIHEVLHTYFPFYTGTNEQQYAWMDEGIVSILDYLLIDSLKHTHSYITPPHNRKYYEHAGSFNDVPPMTTSLHVAGSALRMASYTRPQAAFFILYDYLGHETFVKCLATFTNRWAGKHPTPYDFFNTFNEVSGQNLNWFWKPWFFEFGIPDLEIDGAATTKQQVVVKKNGALPFPVLLNVIYSDGTEKNIRKPVSVWKNENNSLKISLEKEAKSIKLICQPNTAIQHYRLPLIDADTTNNHWVK